MRPHRLVLLALALPVVTPAPARSQDDARLEAAELAADAGDVERAREYLGSWFGSESAVAPDADVGRALVLRARLAESVDSAEVDYLEAAVRGGESYGALARLRLAQLRLTGGRPAIAAADLERLRADFPGSPRVSESWLWSGYALESLGDLKAACAAWERAVEGSPSEPIVSQARDGLSTCAAGQADGGARSTFTVQLGAFGSRDAAEEVRDRATTTGVEVQVRDPDGSTPLYRVRVGRFSRKDDAARVAVRLRAAGFQAIVVSEDP